MRDKMRDRRIVIAGGSGQVGTILARYLSAQGHAVTVLSRSPKPASWPVMAWDNSPKSSWVSALEGCDVLINLSGRSVNCRYTSANRKQIYDSRIQTTRLLHEAVAGLQSPPKIWLNASTATIYRHTLDRAMDEASGELGGGESGAPYSWNFSIKVAKDWESAFFLRDTPRTRKIAMRSAITLSPDRGGAFDLLMNLVRRGLGGTVGSGNQYFSWIHETDFVRAVDWLICHEDISGVVNLSSPSPVVNRDFMRVLRDAYGSRFGIPASGWMIEAACFFMQTESELVLKSRRVIPGRLLNSGFTFDFPGWPSAAHDLVSRWKAAQL